MDYLIYKHNRSKIVHLFDESEKSGSEKYASAICGEALWYRTDGEEWELYDSYIPDGDNIYAHPVETICSRCMRTLFTMGKYSMLADILDSRIAEEMWVLVADSEESCEAFIIPEHKIEVDGDILSLGCPSHLNIPRDVMISHVYKVYVKKEYKLAKVFRQVEGYPVIPSCTRCNDTNGVCCGGSK